MQKPHDVCGRIKCFNQIIVDLKIKIYVLDNVDIYYPPLSLSACASHRNRCLLRC